MKNSIFIVLCYFSLSQANTTIFDYALDSLVIPEKEDLSCSRRTSVKAEIQTLLNYIAQEYLSNCVNVILYDKTYEERNDKDKVDLEKMLRYFPANYINAQILELKRIQPQFLKPTENECRNFILLVEKVSWTDELLGPLRYSKVVVLTSSSRWKIEEYLEGWGARDIVNLLIVSYNWKESVLFKGENVDDKTNIINLYTHNLYTDGLGSSSVRFLTSWRCEKLARNINLFPKKMTRGFNGRQFVVAASEQPPFTFRKKAHYEDDGNKSHLWDGVEIRLLRLLSSFLNYTIEITEPKMETSHTNGPSERVINEVVSGQAEIGSAGVYVTNERIMHIMPSVHHTMDCAAFITKTSTALPGHRAILGPFQWTVWLALTMTYMSAIIPLTFADSHSLKPLLKSPWLIENMFWHVFGTFTNCFTFSEKNSWTKTKKSASRLFIGMYWAFTIIVTACYTGSIVSFITLFVYPDTIDHIDQLLKKNFRIGTLSTGGWSSWFNNSEHDKTKWLLRDVELVPTTIEGLKNASRSFYLPMFRPYAFLAGRAQMEYIVQANFTGKTKKKEVLHITKECFVPFGVSFVFPQTAAYSDLFNEYILRVQQSGLMAKLLNEFKWEVERSSTGKLLQAGSGASLREITPLQRKLTLEDTEGMYLLMGAGYLIGAIVLILEWIHFSRQTRKMVSYKERLSRLLFWRWGIFRSFFEFISPILTPYIETVFHREKHHEQGNNYTSFKKYDSRILGTHLIGATNKESAYFSELHLNRKENFKLPFESRSLPDIKNRLIIYGNQMISLERCKVKERKRRRDLDQVFGSINSLPWNCNITVHQKRSTDRAQSC